jgi:hypothetical protein
MPKIAIDKITPGMVLTKPVTGSNGMVLLAEGTELNAKWIDRLETMGVDGVWVGGAAEQPVPLEEALAALDKRVETVIEKPHMETLKRLVRVHIERLYTKG